MSTPVAAEIAFGLESLPQGTPRCGRLQAEYRRLRRLVRWQDWTEEAAAVFGREKARLQNIGQSLDDMDLAIASIALSLGARLATHNVRHFERIAGLEVEDWNQGTADS